MREAGARHLPLVCAAVGPLQQCDGGIPVDKAGAGGYLHCSSIYWFLSHTAALQGPHLLPAADTLLAVHLQAQTLVTQYATSGGGGTRS